MQNLKTKLNAQGGFTLIEMLLVVGIITILVVVSIPVINTSLEDARHAADLANERAAKTLAVMLYMGQIQDDGFSIQGGDGMDMPYVAGTELKITNGAIYYDAENGVLTRNFPAKSYGQCKGGNGDTFDTTSHDGKVIQLEITANGVFTPVWVERPESGG